ncbi:MAG: two-component system, chemotaxis family, sensor kinase Cph1 [Thermoplasmata archaeon]|nr:two-component system, chemotaxis family, sensor kinase Cph1 [Thermoplasmata archaeon]
MTSSQRTAQPSVASQVSATDMQLATLNILEDFELERTRQDEMRRAKFNILEDFDLERSRAESTQRAVLNILDDLKSEGEKVRAAERALEARAQELGRSNTELQQFAYVASHDLQEPLRTVHGAVQRLSRKYAGQLDAEADEYFRFATEGAIRMRNLIQDLLAFSRVGTGSAPLVPTPLGEVLDGVLLALQASIHESGAVIEHDPLPTVIGDAGQLAQLLQNMVGNAIKFHGAEPPRIAIHVQRQGAALWRIEVQDNGIGIDPQHFDKLFIIFQRLHDRDKYPGTGVGLAISKKIVERHGGKIGVTSDPGQGTTFWFTLPAAARP